MFILILLSPILSIAQVVQLGQKEIGMNDPIQTLVNNLSETNGLWTNGSFKTIELSPVASIEQIIARLFKDKNGSDPEVKVTLLKSTKVRISNKEYQAVMLETNFGKQIILMQHQKGQGWWTKTFAVEDSTMVKDKINENSISQSKEICNGRILFELPGAFLGKAERSNHAFGFIWEEVVATPREKTDKDNMEFVLSTEGKHTPSPVINGKLFLPTHTIQASGGVSASAITPDFVLKMKAAALKGTLKSLFKKYKDKSNLGFCIGPGSIIAKPNGHEIATMEFQIQDVNVSVITKSDAKHSPLEFDNFFANPPPDLDPEIPTIVPPAKTKRDAGNLSGLEVHTKDSWTDIAHNKHIRLKKTWIYKSPKISPYNPDIYVSVKGDEGIETEIDNVLSTILKTLRLSPK